MKRSIILIVFIFTGLCVNAQSSWGITGGKIFNQFYNLDKDIKFDTYASSRSFSAGIFYQKNICTHSSLRLSLSYDDKTTGNHNSLWFNNKLRTELKYITLEALSIIPLNNSGNLTLGGGLYVSKLISAEKILGRGEYEFVTPLQYTRDLDFGTGLMFGYRITRKLQLMAKANLGLVSISSTKNPPRIQHGPLDCNPLPDDINYAGNGGNYGFGQFYSYYNRSITLGVNYTLNK